MFTDCCGANFREPGWPDNDICADCGEHTEPVPYEDTLTEKEKKERSE